MVFANLRSDERIGLGIALGLHIALVAVLLIRPDREPVFEPPERMTVNLATDVGLEATAPDPVRESRAAIAPTLAPEPAPEPVSQPEPVIQPRIVPPRPIATPQPRLQPAPRATTPPRPRPASNEPRRRPDTPSSRTQSTPTPPKRAGGSRIGADFLPGAGDSATTAETRVPASQIGASAKASLVQAISRQLKAHWTAPQGVDVDELVTVLAFDLNPDGSLKGEPRFVRQTGVNPTNRAQADRHKEQAIRAVKLAAPFDLPDQYYDAWKRISAFSFDRKL